ncbi:MalY/PatB family protein [Kurthia gibsonii]|uniref:MalY/PatB family protein n=1 Tax=Kurthia gibsonii TaxID=33946 RepID=UPI002DBDDDA7|nr:MalY/PatB family protein [Kurthia gibsonii]MEB6113237.1 pyridoxal phosphate-dependent aminotransferase [Kurthia gibsonii]
MFNFDETYSRRNTSSLKWDLMEKIYSIPDASKIIPMWVADMDFAAPETITNALKARMDFPLFGYTFEDEACASSVTSWLARRNDWHVPTESVLYHQGVVPAISTIVEAFTNEGDTVLVNAPIYPPFFNVPKKLNRQVAYAPLHEENGVYTFDFETFEEQAKKDDVKLFIFCHPHNPSGTVWSEDVLKRIDTICAENGVIVLSDEIHSDLILNGTQHIPFAKASSHADNVITCVAPTKTFNIAGIQAAMMIVTDAKKRQMIRKTMESHSQMGLNTFALTAVQAAFSEESEAWLHALIDYLNENVRYVIDTITQELPKINIKHPDATYLLWLDMRQTGMTEKEMMQKLLDAGVALDPGTKYGAPFDGFLRMNIACTRETLKEAVKRFIQALS